MKLMLTSCGLETETIKDSFMDMFTKAPVDIKALFIPTAANSPDAIDVLPKCLNDLVKCGIRRENIKVYDLHQKIESKELEEYDVIYLCGGSSEYLLRRIIENGFDIQLKRYIQADGIVLGVSAGSIIFADNLKDNLGMLNCHLDVHCSDEEREKTGSFDRNRAGRIRLGNTQAILVDENEMVIFE